MGIVYSRNYLGKNSYMWKGGLVKRICQTCHKEFSVKPFDIKRSGGKFCSHKCKGIDISINRGGKNSQSWKGGKIKRICQICHKEFLIEPSKLGKYCSKKCKIIGQQKENSPGWKGGITPVTHRIRASDKYKQWRTAIFIRDDFTCRICKQRGGKLHAHHNKKSFSQLLKEVQECLSLFDLYEGAMLYTPLWDIINGITYCDKCHKKLHKKKKEIRQL